MSNRCRWSLSALAYSSDKSWLRGERQPRWERDGISGVADGVPLNVFAVVLDDVLNGIRSAAVVEEPRSSANHRASARGRRERERRARRDVVVIVDVVLPVVAH